MQDELLLQAGFAEEDLEMLRFIIEEESSWKITNENTDGGPMDCLNLNLLRRWLQ